MRGVLEHASRRAQCRFNVAALLNHYGQAIRFFLVALQLSEAHKTCCVLRRRRVDVELCDVDEEYKEAIRSRNRTTLFVPATAALG